MNAPRPSRRKKRVVKGSTRRESGKTRDLQKALKEERRRSKEYLNRLMYLQADFENYRKRMEKEIREKAEMGKEKLIVDLLSVIDALELAVRSGRGTKNREAILEGVEMTLREIYTTLGREGLTKIESVGKPFDPKMHEVVLKVPTNEYDEGVVIEELRRGFMLRGRVIRPSMVKIATGVDS